MSRPPINPIATWLMRKLSPILIEAVSTYPGTEENARSLVSTFLTVAAITSIRYDQSRADFDAFVDGSYKIALEQTRSVDAEDDA